MQVTVLTPTLNRATTLSRAFESLRSQSFRDFEWLVVDDGSTDDTETFIRSAALVSDFPIRYHWQPNAGKHLAMNAGVRLAGAQLLVVMDSDDWLVPDGLACLHAVWSQIARPENYADVRALCVDQKGRLTCVPFPADQFDSDSFELRFRHRISGDTVSMWRTSVLREFPFPEDFHRVYVLESLVYHRIATRYRTRCINEVAGGKEYQRDGISATNPLNVLAQARPLRLYNQEILGAGRPLSFRTRLRTYVLWLRFALLSREPLTKEVREAPDPVLFWAVAPIAFTFAVRDVFRARWLGRRSQGEPPCA